MYSQETVYLDALDGFEFEDLCTKIFERLRWGRVERIGLTKDGGRDIIIHLPHGGSIVIECKHQPNTSIGRPIVQKLHSAVISSGAIKGIIITTGRFSTDAIDHAKILSGKTTIELYDLNRIRDLADKVQIKLLFSGNYAPVWTYPATDMPGIVRKMTPIFNRFQSFPRSAPQIFQLVPNQLKLEAKYLVIYDLQSTLTTTVGTVDSINESDSVLIIDAENGSILDIDTSIFLGNSTLKESNQIPIIACPTSRGNFKIDKTSLTKLVKDYLMRSNVRTVSYRGRNNRVYTKTWQPGNHNISIRDTKQVLLPKYSLVVKSINQSYTLNLLQNDAEIKIESTNLFNCKTCNKTIDKKILLCNDCGKVTHAPKFFGSHGFMCKNCQKTICKDSSYWVRRFLFFKKIICESCANVLVKNGQKKQKLIP